LLSNRECRLASPFQILARCFDSLIGHSFATSRRQSANRLSRLQGAKISSSSGLATDSFGHSRLPSSTCAQLVQVGAPEQGSGAPRTFGLRHFRNGLTQPGNGSRSASVASAC
jgi:hypothetical protein